MDTVRILICAVHGNEAFDGQRALCRWNCSRFLKHGNSQARGRPQWDKPPAALDLPSPDAVYSGNGATGLDRRTTVTITTGKP
jgi:hypothetical protein